MGKMTSSDRTESGPLLDKKAGRKVDVPARYMFSLLGFLACFLVNCLRICLNVAIVAMVNSTAVADLHINNNNNNNSNSNNSNNNGTKHCPGTLQSSNEADAEYEDGEFVWDERTQGTILGAFYYGYVTLQLLGGWAAERVRGKRLLGGGLLLSSLLSFTIPLAARAGPSCLIAVRVMQGVVESGVFPALLALCAHWIPDQERSILVTFICSGSEMGVVCAMLLTGVLSKYGFGGWPSAFYVFGMFGCVWFLLWMVLVFDSPADHPRISDRERRYIQSSVGEKMTLPTPWKDLLSSAPVWGLCIAHMCYCWGWYSLLTCLPTYMKQILGFPIFTNGFLSALPYFLMWVVQVMAGFASDFLRRYCTTAFVRKLMFTIGSLVPACLLVGAGYVDCDRFLAMLLVTLGITAKGMAAAVVIVNHLDFVPKFAGTLIALSNTLATIPGFVGPSVIGALTYQHQTVEQWRKFFIITAAIDAISVLSFWCLGRGEVQSWAAPPLPAPPPTPFCTKRRRQKGRNCC